MNEYFINANFTVPEVSTYVQHLYICKFSKDCWRCRSAVNGNSILKFSTATRKIPGRHIACTSLGSRANKFNNAVAERRIPIKWVNKRIRMQS